MIGESQVIQWYPGHMAQAMRRVSALIKTIDFVIEVVDARIPATSMNPALAVFTKSRRRMIVMTHEDVAEPSLTAAWIAYYASKSLPAIAINGKDQQSVKRVRGELTRLTEGTSKVRALVLGTPNTGKSAIINGLLRRASAKVEDKAGITRAPQWFRVQANLELMDTPGLLVPKIETQDQQWKLAMTSAIPRERFDPENVVGRFHAWLTAHTEGRTQVPDLATFAAARGFLRKGSEPDLHNAALSYMREYNDGRFGRITLELPPAAA